MRKYRVGDCIGYTSKPGGPKFTIVEIIKGSSKNLWGRWFHWDNGHTYILKNEVEFYIPKEYC